MVIDAATVTRLRCRYDANCDRLTGPRTNGRSRLLDEGEQYPGLRQR
jgi:hypothetical protein